MSIALPASVDEQSLPRRLHPGASALVGGPYPNLVSDGPARRFLSPVDGASDGDVVPLLVAPPAPRFRGPFPNLVGAAG